VPDIPMTGVPVATVADSRLAAGSRRLPEASASVHGNEFREDASDSTQLLNAGTGASWSGNKATPV
jgi:hypothetical protein